tara:strand:- start:1977 stop:2552 length:576 start_codon:yes stop_codon:yes gene_type:complete
MSSIRGLKLSEPSLCIPRVFSNITEERVWQVLDELELGEIDRIDMVERETRDGDLYQRVFIHFKSWNGPHTQGGVVRQRILDGEEVKIVYDDPWFWKVSASRSKRPRGPTERRPPRIEFSEGFATKRREVREPPMKCEGASYADAAARAQEEDELNTGLSVDAAHKLSEKMANRPPPPPPTSPLARSWGSA